ncbi:MAG: hypothetical protein SFY80_02300 [Verrucomicrobiota bacterium]|nr:hypothetical protein [Verrucomicrobiota bacterium]
MPFTAFAPSAIFRLPSAFVFAQQKSGQTHMGILSAGILIAYIYCLDRLGGLTHGFGFSPDYFEVITAAYAVGLGISELSGLIDHKASPLIVRE